MCEQVLFAHLFYGNPAPVIRSMQVYYCTASNPGTGADVASHSRPAIAIVGARQIQT